MLGFLPKPTTFSRVGCALACLFVAPTLPADEAPHFETQVRPILKAMCFQCHGEDNTFEGGLDLRLVRLMQAGGDSGASLVPGDVEASLLWQRIAADEMPEGPKKLSAKDKQTIRAWIESGARTVRPEPENVADARFTPEELSFWSFQPPVRPPIPPLADRAAAPDPMAINAIDAFIAQGLNNVGLQFSPEADRATLLRRLKLDLHGLPPTIEELDSFLSDTSENAYERLVDRLLESPQFGVRWARHWLDVAGYSDTDGNPGNDRERPHAWRYRDYVVNAINSDKPYNEFIIEQLAGDECIEGPLDSENERQVELLAATGLLRMAPDITATDNRLIDRNQAVADVVKVVGSAVLGLSVGCAQCHDHRYDPITIDDYYRFRAIFDPVFPLQAWQLPDQRLLDMTTAADRAAAGVIEAQAVVRDEELMAQKREVGKKIFEHHFAAVPEELRAQVLVAIETPPDKQSEAHKKLLLEYPMVRSVEAIVGQLVEFDKINNNENFNRFEAQAKDIAQLRQTKPPARLIMSARDRVDSIPNSTVFFRGDPEQPKHSVQPAELYVLARHRGQSELPIEPIQEGASTGRRLAYAKQLTDGQHPLVARVAVNRMWQHHFGLGLVPTPNDFGAFGQRPTHPELLDWLACELVDSGWQLKRMHKRMVMSRTYRQQSQRTAEQDAIDADNRLYARANLRRMDAETIRDAMLLVSDDLNDSLSGPPVSVAEDGEGRATIGRRLLNQGLFAGIEDVGSAKFRRSLYMQSRRLLPLSLLETFDLPVMNPNCDLRRCSTVAPQALLFLNDQSIVQVTDTTAQRIWTARSTLEERIELLFRKLLSVRPTEAEIAQCISYVQSQRALFAADPNAVWQKQIEQNSEAPDVRAFASLCQALMASNRFLYID